MGFNPMHMPAARLEFDPWIHSTKGGCFIERVAPMLPNTRQEMEVYHSLAWMTDSWPAFMEDALFGASVNANTLSLITGQANTALMEEIAEAYQQYKSGAITRGRYDYRRKLAVDRLKKALGSTERLLFRGKTANEALRISRSKALPATAQIERNAIRFRKISGLALVAIFVTGPVGVVAALAISTATAVSGMALGYGAKKMYEFYDSRGTAIDFVGASGVRDLCQ